MTASNYSARVTITSDAGATVYVLTVATGNDRPGDVAPAYGLADPLVIRQGLTVNERLPLSHQLSDEATVTIIAPDSTTYASIAEGDPVGIQVYPQAAFAGTPVEFYGRIAQGGLNAQPHDLGVIYSIGCIDYLTDLAQIVVGDKVNWPQESAANRKDRIFAEAGIPAPGNPLGPLIAFNNGLAARAKSATDALSALLDVMDSWLGNHLKAEDNTTVIAGGFHTQGYRGYLVQQITGGLLDQSLPFKIGSGIVGTPYTRRSLYAPPARLTNLAGVRTITVAAADSSPSTGAPILDGGRVTFAPTFTQRNSVPVVTTATDAQGNSYTWDWRTELDWGAGAGFSVGLITGYPRVSLSGPAIVQKIDTVLDVTDSGAFGVPVTTVAVYRTPFRPDVKGQWEVGTLEWDLWAEPSAWRRPQLTELLTVARGVSSKLPPGREWIAGMVTATTLTIANGRPTLAIDLIPDTNDAELNRWVQGASLGVASLDSPILSGVTISQLSTRDTFTDYRLVRGT